MTSFYDYHIQTWVSNLYWSTNLSVWSVEEHSQEKNFQVSCTINNNKIMSRMYEFGFTVVHYLIGINYIHLILWFLAVKVAFIYRQNKHQEPTYCILLFRYCIISILFVQCTAIRCQSIIKLNHILQKFTLEIWLV